MTDDGKSFLLGFCDDNYVTEASKGFIISDKIIVTSGSLESRESTIRKIDRHKRHTEIKVTGMYSWSHLIAKYRCSSNAKGNTCLGRYE